MKVPFQRALTFCLALALALTLTPAPAGASAAEPVYADDLQLLHDGTYVTGGSVVLDPGAQAGLTAQFIRGDGQTVTETDLTWFVADTSVATVIANASDMTKATVSGRSPGITTLTARPLNGASTPAPVTCTVIVSGVSLSTAALSSYSSNTLIEGERARMSIGTRTGYAQSVTGWTWTASGGVSVAPEGNGMSAWVTGLQAQSGPISITVTGTMQDSAGQSHTYTDSRTVYVQTNEITCSLDERRELKFADRIYNDVSACSDRINGSSLNYVTGLTVSPDQGTLFHRYSAESDPGEGVSSTARYYGSSGSSELFREITFVPKADFKGTADISYTAYGTNGESYSSVLHVRVGQTEGPGTRLTYTAIEGEPLRFSSQDFLDYCQALNGRVLSYVRFELPDSSRGTLHYGYIDGSIYESNVTASTRYYCNSSPNLDDVWLVPHNGYTGTFTFSFTGRDSAGENVNGEIAVTVTDSGKAGSADQINYAVASGGTVYFNASDFSAVCREATGRELDYINLGYSGSTTFGRLSYNGSQLNSTEYAYYRTASGSHRSINGLSYSGRSNSGGTTTIRFTGYDVTGTSFTGTVRINVVSSDSAIIYYTVRPGGTVTFSPSDFSSASQSVRSRELSYIILNTPLPPSSAGTLNDLAGAARVGSTYYRSSSGSRKLIEDLSFAAESDFSGSVTVPYTGRDVNGGSFYGAVVINSSGSVSRGTQQQPTYGETGHPVYSTGGQAVSLRASDFSEAVTGQLSYALSTVRLALPDRSVGQLCLNFDSPTSFSPVSGAENYPVGSLSRLAFLPHAGFSGNAYIRYTATDTTNKNYSGTILVKVTPPTASAYFGDMNKHAWAVPAVDFLRGYRYVSGTDDYSYSPAGPTRRGDYVLMLSRAFPFPQAGWEGFEDVPQDSYSASAIASARASGIVTGDGDGAFRPDDTLTRQDAAVLLCRTLAADGKNASGSYDDLAAFSDRDEVAPYAVEAMAALVNLGLMQGDGARRLNPSATLTRAEMASLFYRAIT